MAGCWVDVRWSSAFASRHEPMVVNYSPDMVAVKVG